MFSSDCLLVKILICFIMLVVFILLFFVMLRCIYVDGPCKLNYDCVLTKAEYSAKFWPVEYSTDQNFALFSAFIE